MVKHLVLFVSVLFVFGCKESLPPINFDEDLTLLKDTTYVLAEGDIPAAEDQTIVVEDLTGVRCSNCPKAAETAKNIKDQFGSKAVVIGIYPEEPKNLAFPYPGFPDLRTKVSQQVAADIFQFSNQLPGGGVNRRKFSGQTAINNSFNTWVNSSNIVDGEKSAINLSLDKRAVNDSTYELLGEFCFFWRCCWRTFRKHLFTRKQYCSSADYKYRYQQRICASTRFEIYVYAIQRFTTWSCSK